MKAKAVIYLVTLLLLCVAIAVVALGRSSRRTPKVSRTENVGSFAILTHEIRSLRGWNEGRLSRGTTEIYSITHRGAPFRFVGKAGLLVDTEAEYEQFNAVITFTSTEPVILVNVGDANNRSFFYLLREAEGKPQAIYLGEASGGVAADWLDAAPGSPRLERKLGIHRAHLEGGRYLLLGNDTVLDTTTLEAFPLEKSSLFLLPHEAPLMISPDRKSFVRFASQDDDLHLVVFDFVSPKTYSVPIVRTTMRYNDLQSIDAAWIDHHLEWKDGLLVPRESFAPLRHRGRLTTDAESYREYRVQPVRQEMQTAVVDFLRETMKGTLLPRREYSSTDIISVDGQNVNVMFTGQHVGVWMDRGQDSSLMIRIAADFDAALAGGSYDSFFLP
ncbi:MAG TPA: hypothetical protein VF701_12250 [Thermoanaerobaculia bacterium]